MLMVSLYIHVSCPLTYVYYSDVYDFAEYRKVTPSYWAIGVGLILDQRPIPFSTLGYPGGLRKSHCIKRDRLWNGPEDGNIQGISHLTPWDDNHKVAQVLFKELT